MSVLMAILAVLCGIPIGFIAGVLWLATDSKYPDDSDDFDYSGGL